jgi:hypothetical protein
MKLCAKIRMTKSEIRTWHLHHVNSSFRFLHSSLSSRRSSFSPAFTVLELLTVLAFLVIMMGLMVSLARYVRSNSAVELTRQMLASLASAQAVYMSPNAPQMDGLPSDLNETVVQRYLLRVSNARVRHLLERNAVVPPEPVVRDAWGNAILLVPRQHDQLGMAPRNEPFFISAGPDGKYLTLDDNLYSYEQTRPDSISATRPSGGQRE